MKIIFVCTGNTCRSPMAEGYLKSKLIPDLTVESRGLCIGGDRVSENSATVMEELGFDIKNHISKGLSSSDLDADMFICMTYSHADALISAGVSCDKVSVLGGGISDPYGMDLGVYRKCRNEIMDSIDNLLYGGLMNGISVRIANENDIDEIAEIEKENFSMPWSENAVKESMERDTVFFIAEKEGGAIGYMGLTCILDEGYVTNIAVNGNFRKSGAGTLLMNKSIDYGRDRGLSFISLEVRASNQSAISLYNRFSFENAGVRKGFYEKPKEDAIIMTRRFTF
ncbi:MAG: ribosomal protein S18-alanine N-acetyltransferase [Clostridia bacterium]|nr:ribosomal protein S18-alanine N-acetyltransferase [Clostridia bacterium]